MNIILSQFTRIQSNIIFSILFLAMIFSHSLFAQSGQIPKEVKDAVGIYTGAWTVFALDINGQVIKQVSWVDTLKAENPVKEKNRAFITTTDQMNFEGGRIPAMKIMGKEGYLLNGDNTLGDYFIENNDQSYHMQKISDNVYSYTVKATAQELMRLGPPNILSGQHTLLKVVTVNQGMEIHDITRITTVLWKDLDGNQRTIQFVSLKGQHQRHVN